MFIDAARIELLLAERQMTKGALASGSGICRQNITAILQRGSCEPRTAGKLATALGVSVADIRREVLE